MAVALSLGLGTNKTEAWHYDIASKDVRWHEARPPSLLKKK